VTLRRALLGSALVLVALCFVASPAAKGADWAAPTVRSAGFARAPSATTGRAAGHFETVSKEPKPLQLRETCVKRSDRATVVRFRSADGVRLLGVMLGRGPAAVVLTHESRGWICSWLPYGRMLARRGFRVLVFDARGNGSSSATRSPSRRFRFDLDIAAAVREVRRRGARSVVLAGGSLGAMGSLVVGSSLRPPVDGVVAVSPGTRFQGVDAEAAVERLAVPVLYVVATEDAGFPDLARSLYEATAIDDKRLVVVNGFGHGNEVLAIAEARSAVDRFIDEHSRRVVQPRR
jgi:pimeloyl-ACP methyl ester carboxylesterase